MTDRLHQALATAITELEWFAIPHTVDQIIGLYSEALAGQTMRYRHGISNDELLDAIKISGGSGPGGKGGHSDPTADAALHGEPDADDTDGTLGAIDATLALLDEAARELDHLGADAVGQVRWHPPRAAGGRQGQLSVTIARLHHAQPNLDAAATSDPDRTDELVLLQIAEPAAWLHVKCTEIWRASRGDSRPVAVQRELLRCEDCARHGVQSDVADASRTRCAKCLRFRREYHVAPTADIVRSWDAGRQRLTPGMIAEAKAQAKTKRRTA